MCLAESIQVRVLGACTCHQAACRPFERLDHRAAMILAHSEPYTRSSFDMGYVGDRAAFVRDLTWAAVEAWWRGGLVVE